MSSDTLDESYEEIPKAKRKRSKVTVLSLTDEKSILADIACPESETLDKIVSNTKMKQEKVYYTGDPHHAYGGALIPLDSETVQFASHLTGHSEITIKAMYQEWVGNKNAPFKPL